MDLGLRIVTLAVPLEDFAAALATIDGARLVRALPPGRAVVAIPPGAGARLAALPGVTGVRVDSLERPLRGSG